MLKSIQVTLNSFVWKIYFHDRKKKIELILNDNAKAAEAVNLIYVTDKEPGINRIKKGKGFSYKIENKKIDNADLKRIKALVIPPAWESVWICKLENGHLQVTGLDVKNRKQYRYHTNWNKIRNQSKFYHLYDFGLSLPQMRTQLKKDIALPGLPVEKVLATVVSLMEKTSIRVGNSEYEKLNGSFGLATLKDKHVSFNGSKIEFSFKGKSGVEHQINLKSKKLANIVQSCKEIPGRELFQYFNDNGEKKSIDSGMVNAYIKNISSGYFTSKDFRTWAGTVHAVVALHEFGLFESEIEAKKNITDTFKIVSSHLGNTVNVCKKYYVHPLIIEAYENKKLSDLFSKIDNSIAEVDNALSPMEEIVMQIIKP
ncbi:MAG: DNA topoisomerase IB [Chitinophagales bacterium]